MIQGIRLISSKENYKQHLEDEIRKADFIFLIFDMTTASGFDNIRRKWFCLFDNLNINCPIILLGNKLDIILRDEEMFIRNRIGRIADNLFDKSNVLFYIN